MALMERLMLSTVLFGCRLLQVQCMLTCPLHPDPVSCCVQSTAAKSASSKVLIAAHWIAFPVTAPVAALTAASADCSHQKQSPLLPDLCLSDASACLAVRRRLQVLLHLKAPHRHQGKLTSAFS